MLVRFFFVALLGFSGWDLYPQSLNPALQRGIWLAEQNRLQEAEREFDSVPASDPFYWQAQYYSAVAKAQLKKADIARAILNKFIRQFPNHRDAHYLLGMLLEDAYEFKGSETCFRKVTTLSPKDPRGWVALGRVLQAEGKAEEALKALIQAEKLSSDDPTLPLHLGNQYYLMGKYAEAIKYLLPAWQADSTDVGLVTRLATSYTALKDTAKLEGMLQSLPKSILPEVQMAVGLAYIGMGEEGKGFTCLMEGASARAGDFKTQRMLGDAMFRSALYEDAQRVYRNCLALKPDDPETTFLLGRSIYEDRRIAEARDIYLKVVQLMPSFAAAWFHLGICHRALENPAEAREAFLKALKLEPKNPEGLYNLGMVVLKTGGAAAAEGHFQKALALAPDHVGALYELGRIWISQGKVAQGLAQIDHALRVNPNHTKAHYQRGMALRRLGRADEAKQEFAVFQKLEKEDREKRKVLDRKILTPANPPPD